MNSHKRSPRSLLALVTTLALTGLGAFVTSDEAMEKLQAVPLEQRLVLSKKLREFDSLPRDERRAIEELDRRLNDLPVEERDRYHATLRRYATWVQSLPAEQRNLLPSMGVEEKLALVRQSRAEANSAQEKESNRVFFQSTVISPIGLFDSAFLLKTWFRLNPEEQESVRTIKPLEGKVQRLEALAAEHKVYHDYSPIREEFEKLKRDAFPKAAVAKTGLAKFFRPQAKDLPLLRQVEAGYFIVHEPEPLGKSEMMRFEAVLPDWFRETSLALPADVARRRLKFLYPLVFGKEAMPADLKPEPPAKAAATPVGRPSAGPAQGTSPF